MEYTMFLEYLKFLFMLIVFLYSVSESLGN